jgi:hypothetical protein
MMYLNLLMTLDMFLKNNSDWCAASGLGAVLSAVCRDWAASFCAQRNATRRITAPWETNATRSSHSFALIETIVVVGEACRQVEQFPSSNHVSAVV